MSSQTLSLVSDEVEEILLDVDEEQQEADRLAVLETFGHKLSQLAERQVNDRQLIEERWIEDLRQWHGRYDPKTEAALNADPSRSKIYTNLTRTKANSAESRLIETVLPIDDRNWEMRLTPVQDYDEEALIAEEVFKLAYAESAMSTMEDPEMGMGPGMPPDMGMGMSPEMSGPPGMEPMEPMEPGMPPGDMSEGMPPMGGEGTEQVPEQAAPEPSLAQRIQDAIYAARQEADLRRSMMQDEIDDQLTECRYNQILRKVIHHGVVLGTGVLKGPTLVGKTRRRWSKMEDEGGSIYVLEEEEVKRPVAEWVDTWNFFPDMSATCLEEAGFVFERGFYTKSKVRALRKRPGFMEDQLRKVLQDGPAMTRIDRTHLDRIREISGLPAPDNDSLFEVWIYTGPVEAEDLAACGCQMAEDADPLDDMWGEVWMIGKHVIKADVSLLDTNDLPYSVFNWEEDEGSIFGYGVPWRSRHPQRMANGALRMIMENGGLSARPQIVHNEDIVEPADNNPNITPGKVWRVTDRNVPVSSAFGVFEIASHLPELSNIFLLAKQLMDEETAIPNMQAGQDLGNVSGTLGGMSILMNQANIVLRRVVKHFDDNITVPTIRRFYDWNMQYNKRDEIKGDYEIDARGTSSLIAREALSAALIQMMQYIGTPIFQNVFRREAFARMLAKSLQLPVDQLVNTPDEIKRLDEEQSQNQMPDPVLERAKIMAGSQDNKMQITYQMHQERMAQQIDEFKLRAIESQKNWETQVMKLLGEREASAEKIKADLAKITMELSAKNDRFMRELNMKSAYGPRGNYGLE